MKYLVRLNYLLLVLLVQIVFLQTDLDEKILENKTLECHKKFGDVTRKAHYIGRCKNKKIIQYEKLKDINEKNIIQEWSQKCY